ncbi:MAG: histidine phosphatase family protein [Rhodospirillaceae bacterium]|nr:histidine phosphatase family protein [Rhodospirillaceae bacterium]
MKRLYLLRHAKSSWDDPDGSDFERSLSKRGRSAAPSIGRFIESEGLTPRLVLCSTARRTRETCVLVSAGWTPPPEIQFEDALYLAAPETIRSLLAALPANADQVMVIGHNPGIQTLASELGGGDRSEDMQRLRGKYPTGGLAVFDLDIDRWRDIGTAKATLRRFIAPRELD